MSEENLSVKSVPSTEVKLNLNETTDDNQNSQNAQDYEINAELEELTNKIHSEIAKRVESNLKHNIIYIPPLEENKKETLSKELTLLKERIITVANLQITCNNYSKGDCKEMPSVLKSLLESKIKITRRILHLTCIEDVLKCKVKFQENLNLLVFNNFNNEDWSENITFYRQHWRKVVIELNDLKNLETSLDLKINSVMLDTNVSMDDHDFLKHTIQLNNIRCEYQIKHINYLKEAFTEEIHLKDKFIHIMAQMLDMYNTVLRRHSLLTDQMSDCYGTMVRTAQVFGINNVSSQDFGIFNENS